MDLQMQLKNFIGKTAKPLKDPLFPRKLNDRNHNITPTTAQQHKNNNDNYTTTKLHTTTTTAITTHHNTLTIIQQQHNTTHHNNKATTTTTTTTTTIMIHTTRSQGCQIRENIPNNHKIYQMAVK
jgi:hypothetical protein